MNAQQNHIIREITPLSDKDCFYIAERHKTEFTYPIHNHAEFELNFCEKAAGVRRIVGDSAEVIGEYDLVLITGKDLEHVWEQNECKSKEIREIRFSFLLIFFKASFIRISLIRFAGCWSALRKDLLSYVCHIEGIFHARYTGFRELGILCRTSL